MEGAEGRGVRWEEEGEGHLFGNKDHDVVHRLRLRGSLSLALGASLNFEGKTAEGKEGLISLRCGCRQCASASPTRPTGRRCPPVGCNVGRYQARTR